MEAAGTVVILLAAGIAALAGVSGEVFRVGDTQGWTVIGPVDYASWSSSKKFHVGDIIQFEYPSKLHNVMEVTKADYAACNASSPLKTYNSGNDTIILAHPRHLFFICGVPGHCSAGQKVDIRVLRRPSAPSSAAPSSQSSDGSLETGQASSTKSDAAQSPAKVASGAAAVGSATAMSVAVAALFLCIGPFV